MAKREANLPSRKHLSLTLGVAGRVVGTTDHFRLGLSRMIRNGSAVWNGTIRDGSGNLTTPSGVLNTTPYSFKLRFENEDGVAGTNPEELIAAAHAGCFSMAFSGQLTNAGFTPEEIRTNAALTLEKTDAGFTITKVHLTLEAKVPGLDEAQFQTLAGNAKAGCPVSRVLNAEISMSATLA